MEIFKQFGVIADIEAFQIKLKTTTRAFSPSDLATHQDMVFVRSY